MRIISGLRRGKKLLTPEGLDTRPTLDRVKQKMFDCIQFDVADKKVLDLFAGSGQLGLEALSRGAESCHFNDASRSACTVVQKNIAACEFEKKSTLTCNLYTDCVTICRRKGMRFSLVLLDPPYEQGLIPQALTALREADLLEADALIVCEYADGEDISLPEGYRLLKEKKSGLACFCVVIRVSNQT
ncbi:MAG: 16S rRNA (guanine(966)-N(2))-methyltransferase RsmD [Clostridia bacterium]|nr:16S rRNA (guanine(966)-N(2))-methyltransferase RsmD [Clostridia bacterium]